MNDAMFKALIGADTGQLVKDIEAVTSKKTYDVKVTASGASELNNVTKQVDKVTATLADGSKVTTEFTSTMQKGQLAISKMGTTVKTTGGELEGMNQKVTGIRGNLASLANRFTTTIAKVFEFGLATATIALFYQGIATAKEAVFEFDASLVELLKVTDLGGESLENYKNQAYALATELSTSAIEVNNAVTEFAKSGYSVAEAMELGESALVFQTISDGAITAADSATFLTQTLKAYQLQVEDSTRVIDSINEVSNNFSISSNDLSNSIGKVASTASLAGVSFDQLLGIMVASNEIVQNSSKVANGYKSILVNLVNKDLDEQFAAVGINVRDMNGALKPAYDLLQELSVVFNQLGTTIDETSGDTISLNEDMNALLEDIAGKHQINVLSAGLLNFDQALAATAVSMDSAGSASEEFDRAMDSLAKKTEGIHGQFVQLVTQGGIAEFLKIILDLTKALLEIANSGFGQFAIQVGIVTGLIYLGIAAWTKYGLAITANTVAMYASVKSIFANIAAQKAFTISLATAKTGVMALTTAMLANPLFWAVAIVGTIAAIGTAVDHLTTSYEEQKEIVATLTTEYENLQAEINGLENSNNELDSRRLELLKEELSIMERQLAIEKEREYTKHLTDAYKNSGSGTNYNVAPVATKDGYTNEETKYEYHLNHEIGLAQGYEEQMQDADSIEELDKLQAKRDEIVSSLIEEAQYLEEVGSANAELTQHYQDEIEAIYELVGANEESTEALESNAEAAQQNANSLAEVSEQYEEAHDIVVEMGDAFTSLASASDEYNNTGVLSLETIDQLLSLGDEYLQLLTFEGDQLLYNEQAAIGLAKAKVEEAKALAIEQAHLEINNILIAAHARGMEQLEASSVGTANALNSVGQSAINNGILAAKGAEGWIAYHNAMNPDSEEKAFYLTDSELSNITTIQKNLQTTIGLYDSIGASVTSYGGASNAAASSTSKVNDELEEQIELIEKRRDAEIEALEAELEALKRKRDEVEDYWDDLIDAREKENELIEENMKLQELQERIALAKAQKGMIFKDGVFTYGSDDEAISEAVGDLADYEDELAFQDELDDLEAKKEEALDIIDKQIEALELRMEEIEASYELQIEHLRNFSEEYNSTLGNMYGRGEQLRNAALLSEKSYYDSSLDQAQQYANAMAKIQNAINNKSEYKNKETVNVSQSSTNSSFGDYLNSSDSKDKDVTPSVGKLFGRASGDASISKDGAYIVGENPKYREIVLGSKINNDMGSKIRLSKGDGVVNAQGTQTLAGMLNMLANTPKETISENNNSNNNSTMINVDKIVVEGVDSPESFAKEVAAKFKNLVIQNS